MKTSDQGRAALELEEGVVLRAYRDVAGIWTIGCGLTAASGVVTPKAGMVITREEADALLVRALAKYEADVERAMSIVDGSRVERPVQHAFDAGVSFHFNTGAISRASWVALWKDKASRALVLSRLLEWSKAGGKVLPALKDRREREGSMLYDGVYRTPAPDTAHPVYARWAMVLDEQETRAVFDGLRKLGYDPGAGAQKITLSAIQHFQRDHGLTVDGIIGKATLSTLQRALDARRGAVPLAGLAGMAAASITTGAADALMPVAHLDAAALPVALVGLAAHAWWYRDALAGVVAPWSLSLARLMRGH